MAKKSRRARRRVSTSAQPVRISRPVRPLAAQPAAKEVDFAQEYHYVVEDLRRIAIIALGLFLLLLVMVFIIG
jgi:hypothetical protein